MLKLLCSIFLFLHLSSRRRVFSSFLIIFSHPSSPLDTFTVVARSRYINWVWCESLCCCCRRFVQMLFFFRFCSPFPSFSFYCLMNLEEERILRSNVHFHSAGLLVWWSLSSPTHSRSSSQVRCHIVSRPSGIFRIKSDTDPHFSSGDFATYPIQQQQYHSPRHSPPICCSAKRKYFSNIRERVEKWVFKCVQNVCAQIKWIVIYLASVEWAKNIKEWTTFIAYINMMLLLMLHRCRCCFHEKQTKLNEI